LRGDSQDEHSFVQRAVVPDVPHHDRRHLPLGSRQENRSAGYPGD
jgi:hypothetical protein